MTLLTQKIVPFAEFMDEALYGSDGYYASGRALTGVGGDYFTAPETGSAFAHLLAQIFRGWHERLGLTPFHLVEVGAGEGALAKRLSHAAPEFPYVAIERSPARRQKLQSDYLTVAAGIEDLVREPVSGCLFANELLDAFPVHRVRMRNGWLEEAYVDQSRLVWDKPSTSHLVAYLDRIQMQLPDDDYETEINLAMANWFRQASQALTRGLVVLIDYGRPAHEYYAPERNRGTLRAFREHQVSDQIIKAPGRQDLTADVDFTSAALDAEAAGFQPLAYMEMGSFLMEGAKHFKTAPRGLRYLLHPEGMGSTFHVLVLGKDIPWTPADFPNNRIRRLGLEALHAASGR